jgi:hypothetical protein
VPALRNIDRRGNASLLEWIDGLPVDAPSTGDIDAALSFLRGLHGLKDNEDSGSLPLASEACLSGAELEDQVARRFGRLSDAARISAPLRTILGRLTSAQTVFLARARTAYLKQGLAWDQDIDPAIRTLSPSDFGFHNVLRRPDGSLVFIDFEYFGWDDPVKLVCDTLLHPGVNLSEDAADRFLSGALEIYGADRHFFARARALYPMFGLRWCAILLNEFLPEKWVIRSHAGDSDINAAQACQLDKTDSLLTRLLGNDNAISRAVRS